MSFDEITTIKSVLMSRDGHSEADAEGLIAEAQETFHTYLEEGEEEMVYNVCEELFGLEPDFLMELF